MTPLEIVNSTIPYVLDKRGSQERVYDLWSRLHEDRIIFLGEEVNSYNANLIVGQLLYLETTDRLSDIYLYINSPGGLVSAGLAIIDTMRYISCDVATFCFGSASSMAAIILAAGAKGKRFCLPHSEVMIHQPRGGTQGDTTSIEIAAKHIVKLREMLAKMLSDFTGRSLKKVMADIDRDYWMSAEEAMGYGIVDSIMTSRKEGR